MPQIDAGKYLRQTGIFISHHTTYSELKTPANNFFSLLTVARKTMEYAGEIFVGCRTDNFKNFIKRIANMQNDGQMIIFAHLHLYFKRKLLLFQKGFVPIQVDAGFTDSYVAASGKLQFYNFQLLLIIFIHIGRMQPDHRKNMLRKLIAQRQQRLDGFAIDIGQQHCLHTRVECALHHRYPVVVKLFEIKMCVGIDHHHWAKIDVFAWEGLLFLQKTKRLKKYLIIRLSSIGDIVLTTPVVRCLKEQCAPCQVHYLTRQTYQEVVSANPYIDRVFTINKSVKEVLPVLKDENYDLIIDLHKNWRSMAVRRKLGIKSTSFDKLNIRKWLLVNCKIDRLPHVHIVDRYMQTVAGLGVTNDGCGLDYFIPPEVIVPMESLPSSHQQGYVTVVIGGRHNTKQLPAEKTIALCRGIKAPVILLGGPEDTAQGDIIAVADPKHVFNACGKFSLSQSARLVEHASLVITNDTGLMHVAAAFNKKVISIWGNTVPEFGMYPYMPENPDNFSIFEVKGLSCRPCSKIGFENCPRGHFNCMMQQDIAGMIAMANKIVKEGESKKQF